MFVSLKTKFSSKFYRKLKNIRFFLTCMNETGLKFYVQLKKVGEEEDAVEEVILPGVDWESVCYQVLNVNNLVNSPQFASILINLPQFYLV